MEVIRSAAGVVEDNIPITGVEYLPRAVRSGGLSQIFRLYRYTAGLNVQACTGKGAENPHPVQGFTQ